MTVTQAAGGLHRIRNDHKHSHHRRLPVAVTTANATGARTLSEAQLVKILAVCAQLLYVVEAQWVRVRLFRFYARVWLFTPVN